MPLDGGGASVGGGGGSTYCVGAALGRPPETACVPRAAKGRPYRKVFMFYYWI